LTTSGNIAEGPIPDEARLFRHTVSPVAFAGSRFAPEKLMRLVEHPENNRRLLTSLAWEKYLPTLDLVHQYGCRMAARRNEKAKADRRYKEKSRQVYCGCYELRANCIRRLIDTEGLADLIAADVFHKEEGGEIAHIELAVEFGDAPDEGTKTALVDRLWNICCGPEKHICKGDDDISPHPSEKLLPGPKNETKTIP
jgi:hypothetical protein